MTAIQVRAIWTLSTDLSRCRT